MHNRKRPSQSFLSWTSTLNMLLVEQKAIKGIWPKKHLQKVFPKKKNFLKSFKVFGTKAYINVLRTRRDKLDEVFMKRTLVGKDEKIEQKVYIQPPLGFVNQGQWGLVYNLNKTLYGFK